ncbi:MAG: DNA repair protein RecN [Ignavibacteria bacterium]|nr:DNA repair protein RecN [Ignavibacteria bacterium]
MLEKLYIKNYLIIKEAELNFEKGLNIITGETGAGKSIILDALGLLLGDRGNYSIIKNENEKMVVEGIFNFNNYKKAVLFLNNNDLSGENKNGYVIIRRELSKKGISRVFVNDTPVNISLLKEFGDIIIDIHSQNEHQSLLRKETHLEFLDSFTGENPLLEEYTVKFDEYKKLIANYETLKSRKETLQERKSYIEFQLKEINNVNPQPDEDKELEQYLKKLENSELINEAINNAQALLYEKDENVSAGLSASIKEIRKIVSYDKTLERMLATLEESYFQVKNTTEELREFGRNINFDRETTEQIRQRLSTIAFLKKKYGLSVNELVKKAADLTEELNAAENYDFESEKLEKEIKEKLKALYLQAEKLTDKRKTSAARLENALFKVKIEDYENDDNTGFTHKNRTNPVKLTRNGKDNTEFFVRINKGEDFTPLRKTASGGEISRIMLSLKASISGKESVPVLVFDEIDAGISGKTADKVGKLLSKLSVNHQIIAITHLPQIAASGKNNLRVSKRETETHTLAEIKTLNEKEKIDEVAKLISGKEITLTTLKAAEELIKQN